ncbi:hypothetical protein ADEAN_000328700 [Angomonas deanei]|uniref:Uncharacterized protein n=1 Tax=Angomonas deanei TaxID=59799 RepID=A0A7G2C8C0_9TRYP|nr:hypothetical protein ADEAN_000328700 [Angomonas deanei]
MLRVGLRCASANRLWRAPNPFFTMRWGKRLLSNQCSPISPQSSMEKIIELFSRPHAPPESVKPYVDSIDEKETLIALPTIITLMELFTVGSSRGGAVLQRSRAVDLFPIEDRLVDTTVSRLSEWTSSSIEDPVECETRFRYGVSVWLYTSRVSASPPSGDVFRRLKQEVLFPNLRQMKQSGTTPCDARDLYSLVVDCGVWGSVFFTLSSSLPKDCWLYVLKRYTDSLSRVQEGVTAQLENVNEQSEASLIDGMESLSLFMTLTERAVYPIYLQGASEAPTHAVLDRLHKCAWASLQVVERSFRASPAVVTAWAARYTAWLKMVHYTVEQWCVSVSAVYEERLGGMVRRILSLFVQLTFAAWEKVKLHFDDWCALSDVLEAADRLGCDTEQNEGDAASPSGCAPT